ncbi:MAG TPA: hypothetical protein VFY15_05185 [Acidimicrobiia bacterium]|nr:hypothetical protein [Acidimicrobiia bacterium]
MTRMRLGLALGLVVALGAAPTIAIAQETTTTETTVVDRHRPLAELKERAQNLIDHQQAVLDRLAAAIELSRFITEGHAGRLHGDISGLEAELEQISRQVEDATTLDEVWALIREVHGLHIGEVTAPKTHQVIASDTLVAIGGKLNRFADRLENLLERAAEAGYDVGAGWDLLEEMERLIGAGIDLADPVAESVIGLDGDDWPDPAQDLLAAGRRDLRAAGADLRTAYGKGREIVEILRSLNDEA